MATIRDVARAAGVGVATVSRVLSSSPRVAPGTRHRVQQAMARLGYRPSRVARALSRGRTATLEVVVPLFTRYFYQEILRGIETALAETDYALIIRTIERPADRARFFADPGDRGRADGVLIVSLQPSAGVVERLAVVGLPVVLIDAEYPGLSGVVVDHQAAAEAAVRHLLALGHRRIALIDHPQDPFSPVSPGPRQLGYRAALAEGGIAGDPAYEHVTDFSPEAGRAALEALLGLHEPPTAVFVGSDTQAIGVLEAARRRGLRVPGDLSIVGYNDIELAQYLGLTTMRVPAKALGQTGSELLLAARLDPSQRPTTVRFAAELVVRETTGPAAGRRP